MPTTTAASPRFLHQFVFVVGDHCIRRFQVAYPVALLAVPGLLYRNSNTGIDETFAWNLLGHGAILNLAGLLARPIEAGCASRTETRTLYPAIACAAAGIGSGVITGRTTGVTHLGMLLLTVLLMSAAAVLWTIADAGRTTHDR